MLTFNMGSIARNYVTGASVFSHSEIVCNLRLWYVSSYSSVSVTKLECAYFLGQTANNKLVYIED